jgi:Zn-dependent protease with chaperone function
VLLPLLCILFVLQTYSLNLVAKPGEGLNASSGHLIFEGLGHLGQCLLVWFLYFLSAWLAAFYCSRRLPERFKYHGTPVLLVLSAIFYVLTIPYCQYIPIWLGDQITGDSFDFPYVYDWLFLGPFLVAQTIILIKPGFDHGTGHKKTLMAALRFQLMLLSPYLILSPLLSLIPQKYDNFEHSFLLLAGLIMVMLAVAPFLVQFMMKTKAIESSEAQQAIEDQAKDLNIKYKALKVWESGPGQINAAVVGTLPALRYLVITRGMLESFSLSEIKLVFWHEFGHIKHKHMWIYFLFFSTMANLGAIAGYHMQEAETMDKTTIGAVSLTSLFVFAFGFSFISRRLEKQADLFALNNNKEELSYCEVLKRLAFVTGIPYKIFSLTHGSLKQRVTFLEKVIESPAYEARFNFKLRAIVISLSVIYISEWMYWLRICYPTIYPF